MQFRRRAVTLITITALAASPSCSSSGGSRPRQGAVPNASVVATPSATPDTVRCTAAVRGVDVSSWRVVAEKQFTFCLPADWQGRSGIAHHGRSTINWGTGRPRATRVAIVTREIVRPGQRPMPPELPPGSETYQFAEVLGGRSAKLYRNRFNGTYYVGAVWETESIWLNGETPDSQAADLILAVARTVRFVRQ